MREIPHPGRRRRVVRRGGKTIADLIDDNYEIFVGVERAALTDIHLLDDLVGAGVPGRNKDGVIFGGIERTERRIGEFATADVAAFFQFEITDVVQFVRAVHLLRVVAVIDHCPLPSFLNWPG
jgi:hypothetical protein